MTRSLEIEFKVGIFVALGILLTAATVLTLGGGSSVFEKTLKFKARFGQVEGLVEGATVKISGMRAGKVTQIKYMADSAQIMVDFEVMKRFSEAVHADSTVGIQTQGMLGDRYLVVSPGTPGTELAPADAELRADMPKELKDYLSNADEVLDRVKNSMRHIEGILGSFDKDQRAEKFFRNMSEASTNLNAATQGLPAKSKDVQQSMTHMRSILAKIDNGQGTLGALINDPSLFDDVKTLLGGANRNKVLKYFIKKSVEGGQEAKNSAKP